MNEKLKTISNLSKLELDLMKQDVFNKSQEDFNLGHQIKKLIEEEVF